MCHDQAGGWTYSLAAGPVKLRPHTVPHVTVYAVVAVGVSSGRDSPALVSPQPQQQQQLYHVSRLCVTAAMATRVTGFPLDHMRF
jgi:hypothetical protein